MANCILKSREKRKHRVRFKLRQNNKSGRVRLSVFRSNNHFYAQIIDDVQGCTLASASTNEEAFRVLKIKSNNKEAAQKIGELISDRAKKAGIGKAVFDKGAYSYHGGKVTAFAEVCRHNDIID
jgi:large subunit ribosomal protein L18